MENKFQRKIQMFQTDEGGKYINDMFKIYLEKHVIHHKYTCRHHPEQNGMAEHKHRHLVETGLTLLAHASLSQNYGVEAFHTANFLINRLPTKVLNLISPTKLLHKEPSYEFFEVFGCACLHFFRLLSNQLGYRCLDPSTGRVFMSKHVIFDETCFPFRDMSSAATLSSPDANPIPIRTPELIFSPSNSVPIQPIHQPSPSGTSHLHSTNSHDSTSSISPALSPPSPNPLSPPSSTSPTLPTSSLILQPSTSTTHHHMVTLAKDGIHKPNPKYVLPSPLTF